MTTRLITGSGCVARRGADICAFGNRCLIVTGKNSARKCGALDDVIEVLNAGGVTYQIYDAISPNPTVNSCLEGAQAARNMGADFVIGIGGGSALDAAKVVALSAVQPMTEADLYGGSWPEQALPIVLVGTTAGTGSEITNVSVLTDSSGRKHSVHDDRLYASLALGDPKYTASLSRSVSLSTGIDALAHCLESYFSKKANPISQAFSIQGISMLMPALEAVLADRADDDVREDLYNGSILGGLAISITGTVFPHNVGYYLTEHYGVPHGIACAIFLPDLLLKLEDKAPDALHIFSKKLGTHWMPLSDLIQSCTALPDITMTREEIAAVLPRWESNGSVKNTLIPVTVRDIEAMLLEKFT